MFMNNLNVPAPWIRPRVKLTILGGQNAETPRGHGPFVTARSLVTARTPVFDPTLRGKPRRIIVRIDLSRY